MSSSTQQSHLAFYESKINDQRIFHVDIGDTELHDSFHNECVRAATLIAEQFNNETIWLTLSGGMDSEVVARSFLKAGINIKCAIMAFENGLNEHDICHALAFCKEQNVQYEIFNLNLEDFYARGAHLHYAKEVRCSSPQIATHLWLAENLPGPFVFSGTPPLIIWRGVVPTPSNVTINIDNFTLFEALTENAFCLDRLILKRTLRGISNFFLYTPELILSASKFLNPFKTYLLFGHIFQNLAQIYTNKTLNLYAAYTASNSIKFQFYCSAGFDVRIRPNKFTGFELLHRKLGDPNISNVYLRQMYGLSLFNKLYRQPMQAIANQPQTVHIAYGHRSRKKLQDKTQFWIDDLSEDKKWVLSSLTN